MQACRLNRGSQVRLQLNSALLDNCFLGPQTLQSDESRFAEVFLVGASEGFGEDITNADELKNGPNVSSGFDASTGSGGEQPNQTRAELALHLVRNCSANQLHKHHPTPRILRRLFDSCGNFFRLAVTNANVPLAITSRHKRLERKVLAALDYFRRAKHAYRGRFHALVFVTISHTFCHCIYLLSSELKLQPGFTSRIREGLDPTMITISITIERNLRDALGYRLGRN